MNKKIGVIGAGFVGGAIINAYRQVSIDVLIVDPKISKFTIKQLIHEQPDVIFVAVPSPANEDGSYDTTILESVIEQLKPFKQPIISKVTATPDVYHKLSKQYNNLMYCPEFLTAINANQDYLDATSCIIGGGDDATHNLVLKYLKAAQPNLDQFMFVDIKVASLIKYTINSFLATKVVFLNELEMLCRQVGVNYDDIKTSIMTDKRMGTSHFNVPGHNGKIGFGGACFPKDTKAFLHYAKSLKINLDVLETAVIKNDKVVKYNCFGSI